MRTDRPKSEMERGKDKDTIKIQYQLSLAWKRKGRMGEGQERKWV